MKLAQKLLPFATPPVRVSSKRHSRTPPFCLCCPYQPLNACLVKVGLSLQSDMSRAQLVISHAGAGTCLEVRHCQDQFRVCQGQFRVLHGHPGLRVIFVPVWVSSAGSVRSCVCRKISKIMPDMLTTLLLVLKKGLVLNISSG